MKDDINFNTSYNVTESRLSAASVLQGALPNGATNIAAVMGASFGGFDGFNSTNTDWNAALQVALWNAEYAGTTLDPSFITGTPNATVLSEAEQILAVAFANPTATASYAALGFANTILFTAVGHPQGYGQDMVTWSPPPGDTPNIPRVPEPASATLLGFGILGLLGSSAFRKRATLTVT